MGLTLALSGLVLSGCALTGLTPVRTRLQVRSEKAGGIQYESWQGHFKTGTPLENGVFFIIITHLKN
jgi:outer membrane lipoprotein-sorting protein